ncbi:hypothetical protein PV326_010346 [Microctonus aethiopoides]|nr:hypothetical protein PV326_010346 [Microctonus aethiopoides]
MKNQHYDNVIESPSAASTHKCLLGHKNIYASDTDSHVLFVLSEESEKPDTDNNLDEEPGDLEDSSSSSNQPKCMHSSFNESRPQRFQYTDDRESRIFHKEKNVSDSHTLSSTILPKNLEKRQNREASEIEKPTSKKNKVVEASCSGVKSTSFEKNAKPVECKQQKSRDEKLPKYLKDKENEIEVKEKAVEVRGKEVKMKKELAAEKLRFNEKKHEDWLNIESKKYKLLAKFLKTNSDSEDSES